MPLPLLHSAVRSPNHSDLAQCSLEITSHYQIAAAAAAAVVRRRHSWSWAQSRQPGTLSCDSIPSNPVEDCHARSWQCQCAQWTTCRRNCHFLFAHSPRQRKEVGRERAREGDVFKEYPCTLPLTLYAPAGSEIKSVSGTFFDFYCKRRHFC